jgi:hypothetical protein
VLLPKEQRSRIKGKGLRTEEPKTVGGLRLGVKEIRDRNKGIMEDWNNGILG